MKDEYNCMSWCDDGSVCIGIFDCCGDRAKTKEESEPGRRKKMSKEEMEAKAMRGEIEGVSTHAIFDRNGKLFLDLW